MTDTINIDDRKVTFVADHTPPANEILIGAQPLRNIDAPLLGPLGSIILLLTPEHGPLYLRKFMREHGFVRSEELEVSEISQAMHAKRYRLFRR